MSWGLLESHTRWAQVRSGDSRQESAKNGWEQSEQGLCEALSPAHFRLTHRTLGTPRIHLYQNWKVWGWILVIRFYRKSFSGSLVMKAHTQVIASRR